MSKRWFIWEHKVHVIGSRGDSPRPMEVEMSRSNDGRWRRAKLFALFAALAVASGVTLAACGSSSSSDTTSSGTQGGEITISQTSQPDFLDPALSYTVNGWEPMWLVYTPLMLLGAAGSRVAGAQPGLPSAPRFSRDWCRSDCCSSGAIRSQSASRWMESRRMAPPRVPRSMFRVPVRTENPEPRTWNPAAGTGTGTLELAGYTLSEAVATPAFWIFAVGAALYGLVASGIGLFNESVLAERGFGPNIYCRTLVVTAITGLTGNFIGGWLARFVPLNRLMAVSLSVLAAGLLALPHISTLAMAMGWAVMMGLGGGLVMVLFFSVWPRCRTASAGSHPGRRASDDQCRRRMGLP